MFLIHKYWINTGTHVKLPSSQIRFIGFDGCLLKSNARYLH